MMLGSSFATQFRVEFRRSLCMLVILALAASALPPAVTAQETAPRLPEEPPAAALPGGAARAKKPAGPGEPQPRWGSLRGRFVFDGPPLPPRPVDVPDAHYWNGKEWVRIPPFDYFNPARDVAPIDESLLIDRRGGIANVLIWVRSADIPLPADTNPPPANKVFLRAQNHRFDPHVVAMQSSQTLVVENHEKFAVNFSLPFPQSAMNLLLPSKARREVRVDQQRLPVHVTCAIHPWMKALLLVRDNPYFAVSDRDGTFHIDRLPPGRWQFQVWHEKAGYVKRPAWPKGRFHLTIEPGLHDLGEIRLGPQHFDLAPPPDADPVVAEAPPVATVAAWFRPAPYPELGFPAPDRDGYLYARLANHEPVHDEIGATNQQRDVLKLLYKWTLEDKHLIPPGEDRDWAWERMRRRAGDLLGSAQRQRIEQLRIQQRRHEVFLHPQLAPQLALDDDQQQQIHAAWRAHLARLAKYKERAVERVRLGQESYRQFWQDVHDVLSPQQRRTYERLRGPPIKS